MSDTPETLAAILAEMRASAHDSFASKLVAEYEETGRLDDGPAAQALKDDDVYLVQLADRIERAAKSTENAFGMALAIEDGLHKRDKQSAHGNAAALREALENAISVLRDDLPTPRDISRAFAAANAALAAPARNCDRPFQLVEEAIGAYVTERGDGTHLGYCDAIKWMLDQAEGGAK
jgi:hypothetical protein